MSGLGWNNLVSKKQRMDSTLFIRVLTALGPDAEAVLEALVRV